MSLSPDTIAELGASLSARVFALCCGTALCFWTLYKLRKRSLLISICSLFVAIGGGLMAFAVVPGMFNRLSYVLGIKYPPLLYLILAILSLVIVILHLATRVSRVDERCRRLAQEIALRNLTEGYITRETP